MGGIESERDMLKNIKRVYEELLKDVSSNEKVYGMKMRVIRRHFNDLEKVKTFLDSEYFKLFNKKYVKLNNGELKKEDLRKLELVFYTWLLNKEVNTKLIGFEFDKRRRKTFVKTLDKFSRSRTIYRLYSKINGLCRSIFGEKCLRPSPDNFKELLEDLLKMINIIENL